jgi:hypothetical protein
MSNSTVSCPNPLLPHTYYLEISNIKRNISRYPTFQSSATEREVGRKEAEHTRRDRARKGEGGREPGGRKGTREVKRRREKK